MSQKNTRNINLFILVFLTGLFGFISISKTNSYKFNGAIYNKDTLRFINPLKKIQLKPDTIAIKLGKSTPDTNFTYEKYTAFLKKIADPKKYIIVPVDEFRSKFDNKKVVISLRHDMDVDITKDYQFSEVEKTNGVRSTYYVLHTAGYYLANQSNMASHSEAIIPILKKMQNDYKHEIGWHNDLVTLQLVYKIDPISYLHQELGWLRNNGLIIKGTASHGSGYCYTYKYLNYYFFEECMNTVVGQFVNNQRVIIGSDTIMIKHAKLSDFNLKYEAYFLNNNKYFSDATMVNGQRWHPGMLNLDSLKPSDRVIILTHPYLWHKASILAEIVSFSIAGQKLSSINKQNSSVYVEMPYGTNRNILIASFSLSPAAYAKSSSGKIISGITPLNYSKPQVLRIVAENRDVYRDWTINVVNAKNPDANIETFTIAGLTKTTTIDKQTLSISLIVEANANVKKLPIQFTLSEGARLFIGEDEQFSNKSIVDFTTPLVFRVIAENELNASDWVVSVGREINTEANFLSYSLPGAISSSLIDILNKSIRIDYPFGFKVDNLIAGFEISPYSHAYIGSVEQFSNVTSNDFTFPLTYKVIAENGNEQEWIVNINPIYINDPIISSTYPNLDVFPNPSTGKVSVKITKIIKSPSHFDISSIDGKIIYSSFLLNSDSFTFEVDLSGHPAGVYFVRLTTSGSQIVKKVELYK